MTIRRRTWELGNGIKVGLSKRGERVEGLRPYIYRVSRALMSAPRALQQCQDSAELIVRTIQRDVRFYDPVITEEAVASMNAFAQTIGYLPGPVPYEQVVDVRFRQCWKYDALADGIGGTCK